MSSFEIVEPSSGRRHNKADIRAIASRLLARPGEHRVRDNETGIEFDIVIDDKYKNFQIFQAEPSREMKKIITTKLRENAQNIVRRDARDYISMHEDNRFDGLASMLELHLGPQRILKEHQEAKITATKLSNAIILEGAFSNRDLKESAVDQNFIPDYIDFLVENKWRGYLADTLRDELKQRRDIVNNVDSTFRRRKGF